MALKPGLWKKFFDGTLGNEQLIFQVLEIVTESLGILAQFGDGQYSFCDVGFEKKALTSQNSIYSTS